MTFTYQPNIPLATDLISNSQADINANFQYLQGALSADHHVTDSYPATNEGHHDKVTYVDTAGADPATLVTNIATYVKPLTFPVVTPPLGIFMRQALNGAVTCLSGATPVSAAKGYTTLPGGTTGPIYMQWETVLNVSDTNVIPYGFPNLFSGTAYFVIVMPGPSSGASAFFTQAQTWTQTNFELRFFKQNGTGAGPGDITYIAVGPG